MICDTELEQHTSSHGRRYIHGTEFISVAAATVVIHYKPKPLPKPNLHPKTKS